MITNRMARIARAHSARDGLPFNWRYRLVSWQEHQSAVQIVHHFSEATLAGHHRHTGQQGLALHVAVRQVPLPRHKIVAQRQTRPELLAHALIEMPEHLGALSAAITDGLGASQSGVLAKDEAGLGGKGGRARPGQPQLHVVVLGTQEVGVKAADLAVDIGAHQRCPQVKEAALHQLIKQGFGPVFGELMQPALADPSVGSVAAIEMRSVGKARVRPGQQGFDPTGDGMGQGHVVVVEDPDQIALGQRQAPVDSGGLPAVNLADGANAVCVDLQQLSRAVLGAVIDHDDFQRRHALRQQAVEAFAQVVGPVERGHKNGHAQPRNRRQRACGGGV